MRIGIDARLYGRGLGLGRYVSKLIQHLETLETEHSYVIFLRKENFHLYTPKNPMFQKVCANVPWYSFREQLVLPWLFYRARCDLLHVPHFNIPLLYPGKISVTIHDLILLAHPQSATSAASTRHPLVHWIKYQAYRIIILLAIMRACRIIAVSRAVENNIRRSFPFVAKKIRLIYEAADILPEGNERQALYEQAKQLFFLYVGNSYPHKNLNSLLAAMGIVHQTHPAIRLILCGQEDYFQKKIVEAIRAAHAEEYILHIGCVSDTDLRWFYEHAVALVLPSRAEGFGLQILEAFLHSCPVIASRIPPYEEICGDAAYFVDAEKPADIAHGMNMLLSDIALRSGLILRGKHRARSFSWDECAKRTVNVYNECISLL